MKTVKYILLILSCLYLNFNFAQCGPLTPSFTVNLVGQPGGTWISPMVQRNDNCCGTIAPDKCLKFTIFLDPGAMGINFQIASGAVPPGALFYQINCGPPIAVGSPICLNGAGPHILTFCKPGNNNNTYAITSIPKPAVPDSVMVRSGCSVSLAVTGFSVPTINWTSVFPGPTGAYNGYLSCVSGCASVVVTPTGTPPPFVDYVVSGFAPPPCLNNSYQDTVRVYFYNDLIAAINPSVATICYGQTNALLTATVSGGLAPYSYTWSTGSNNQTVSVVPGTYTVYINDNTGCPPTSATAVVNSFSIPISANAGPDQTLCKSSPNANLSGSIVLASGGMWSGGTGTYSPSQSSLNITYIPTPAELVTGSVQLSFTTTGNYGCPPGSDNVIINYQTPPLANAGPNATVCANNSQVNLSGSIGGFSSTPIWSTGGSGIFTSSTNLSTTYYPSPADISGGFINITLTTTNNGVCPPSTSTMQIIITPSPVVIAGPNQTICSSSQAALNGTVSGPTSSGFWTSSGSGTFSPSPNILNPVYFPSQSDITNGTAALVLTSTGNGNCIAVSNSLLISIIQIATVTAGPSQTVCSNANTINLSGNVTGVTNTGNWSTNGTGAFNPGPGFLTNTYFISPGDIVAGTRTFSLTSTNNGLCPAVTNTLSVTIIQLATLTTGPNQTVCSNAGAINLTGNITGGTNTGNWGTSGTGIFSPGPAFLNTSYAFTPADIGTGTITFSLSSTNNGPCPAVTNILNLTIIQLATITTVPSQTICSNANTFTLSGNISGGTNSGNWWTTGTGAFNPGPGFLNNTYYISPGDVGAGTLTFSLTSTNNGPCPAVTRTLGLSIIQLATLTTGPSQTVCSNAATVSLTGNITGGTNTGNWGTTGTGVFSPGPAFLNNTYAFTPADISGGTIIFSLTSTNNGPCPAVMNTLNLTLIQLATVTTVPSQTICSNANSFTLSGNISGGTNTGSWWTTGTGAFNPGPGFLNNTYYISPGDIVAGTVTFSLTSTNNGPCPAVTNTLLLSIVPLATLSTAPSQTLCSTTATFALNGAINPNPGIWTSNGAGAFIPNNTVLNATYSISPADIIAGSVIFTLSSTNNGPCPVVSNSLTLTLIQLATITTGPSQTVCSNAGTINLSGNISGGTNTGNWNTNGTGVFNPGPTSLNNTYAFTPTDIGMGTVTFSLTSTNNGPCPAVTNTLLLNIVPLATLSAGPSQTLCSTAPTLALNGAINPNPGIWTSNGAGAFIPNNTVLNATYSISPSDIIAGSVIFTLSSTNNGPCPIVSNSLTLTLIQLATITTGPSQTVCSNAGTINLSGNISGGTNTGNWNTNGTGVFNPGPTSLNNTYAFTPTDIGMGTLSFSLTSTNNGPCPAVTNTVNLIIIQLATLTTGPSQTVCSNGGTISLTGNITGGTNSGNWATSGNGIFNPGPGVLNNTYSFTPSDIGAGALTFSLTSTNNGPCPAVTNVLNLNIIQLSTVTTAPGQTVCSNSGSINLAGNITGGTNTGNWATTGTGAFNPGPSALNNIYSFTPNDIFAGILTFSLTSTNNGPCPAVTNTVNLSIIQIATVNAGPNQALCSTAGTIGLNGIANPNSGIWTSSGIGAFIPNNTISNPTYSISPGDLLTGSVTFTLSSTNNGPCPAVRDSVKIQIKNLAVVNVSPSQTVCSNAGTVNLSGNISGGTNTGNWATSGTGVFNPGPSSLNNTYAFTPTDIGMGTVAFSLTSSNNGPCPAVTNTLNLNIIQLSSVNAGPNQALCLNTATIGLNGVANANSVIWTSNGVGAFTPNNTSLNPTYSISPGDFIAGSVTFTLSSTNNGPCPVVRDSVKILIKSLAIVNAGTNQAICSSSTLNLNGNISNGTSTGIWSTNGSGSFNPAPGSLNNTYSLSTSDQSMSTIIFTLSSLNNGPCPAVSDTMMLSIFQAATVNAGPNQAICSNNGTLALTGSVSNNSNTGIWSCSGTGSLSPGNTNLTPLYSVSVADANAGFVTFTLASTNNGICPVVKDTVKITIKKLATINAGPDKIICTTTTLVAISGSVTNGSSGAMWSQSGNGAILPNTTSLNITYGITEQDINSGVVHMILTSLNNGACPAVTDTAKILIVENPSIQLARDTAICSYQNPITLKPNISGDIGQLEWSSNGAGYFIPNNLTNPVTYNFAGDIPVGVVTLFITALNNGPCANFNSSIRVVIRRSPEAKFSASTYTANIPTDPVTFSNQSLFANTYSWDFGDGSSSGLLNPVHNYSEVGRYKVMLVATNQYGCSDTAHDDILVISDIQFPNVFTPNSNGPNGGSYNINEFSNDVFFPYTSGVTEYNLQIFNRWGELIFESNDLKVGWDGYFKNKLCQQDGYVWKADVKFFDGRKYNKTGSVTLLR